MEHRIVHFDFAVEQFTRFSSTGNVNEELIKCLAMKFCLFHASLFAFVADATGASSSPVMIFHTLSLQSTIVYGISRLETSFHQKV